LASGDQPHTDQPNIQAGGKPQTYWP